MRGDRLGELSRLVAHPRPRHWTGAQVVGVLLASVLSLAGCTAGRLNLQELPDHPIAITYWGAEDARRRADLIVEAAPRSPRREGIARLEDIGTALGVYDSRRQAADLARYPGRLSLVDPRTGEVDRIEAAPPGAVPLVWSLDGQRLMFSSSLSRGQFHLYEYELVSGEVRRLTHGSEAHQIGAYGPDDRLVYAGVEVRGRTFLQRVYVTGPYGGSPVVLSEGVDTVGLAWSPEGTPVVYVRSDKRSSGKPRPILVARPPERRGDERELGPGRDPVFTPDGEWIVYSAPKGDGWRLRRMRPDGSGRTSIGTGTRNEVEPTVSPDGTYVAYVGRDASEIDRLYVRRMDGTGDRILIESGGAASPAW